MGFLTTAVCHRKEAARSHVNKRKRERYQAKAQNRKVVQALSHELELPSLCQVLDSHVLDLAPKSTVNNTKTTSQRQKQTYSSVGALCWTQHGNISQPKDEFDRVYESLSTMDMTQTPSFMEFDPDWSYVSEEISLSNGADLLDMNTPQLEPELSLDISEWSSLSICNVPVFTPGSVDNDNLEIPELQSPFSQDSESREEPSSETETPEAES